MQSHSCSQLVIGIFRFLSRFDLRCRILYGNIDIAIHIKKPEVEKSIRALARQLGVDLTEAVGSAVANELERNSRNSTARLAKMRAIADRVAALPIRDTRSDDEILGYDDWGLPR
jgi:antitoxin VapB